LGRLFPALSLRERAFKKFNLWRHKVYTLKSFLFRHPILKASIMSRWRPAAPSKSPYITPEGYARLQAELQALWRRRAGVAQALAEAAAEGDRSENAEYIYRKKELREIDRRIRYLEKRIPTLKVPEQAAADHSRVYFGAWVRLENAQGDEVVYRIVGPDEFDPGKGWISMDSPLARALFKKTIEDEVQVQTPEGEAVYFVLAIDYAK
jgi:transcription elongation factor GreB